MDFRLNDPYSLAPLKQSATFNFHIILPTVIWQTFQFRVRNPLNTPGFF